MLKTVVLTVAAILCCCVSSFFARDSKKTWQKATWYAFFAIAILLIILQGQDSISSGRALARVQEDVSNDRLYGEVATWNLHGSRSISDAFSLPADLTGWTDGFVKDSDGQKQIRFDAEAIAHYKSVQKRYPRYPFPYYLLAEAYRLRKDPMWHEYAGEAIRILEITTSVPGHAPNHDQALSNLKEALASEQDKE